MKSLADLFIIGFSPGLQLRRFTEHAHFYVLPHLPLPILRYFELFVLGQILTFWLIVRHRVRVVVAQSPYEGFVAALAVKLAAWCGSKAGLVVEVHGDFEGSLFMYRRIRLPYLYRFVMKHTALYSIKQADLLRAISDSTTEQIKRCAPRKSIVQFPTWTDIDTFMRNDIQMKKSISRTILYAGMLIPLKGVHHLINAFVVIARDFPNAQLVIVGKEQNKSYAADLREQIRRCGLDERVRLIGPQPQSELARLMSNASVFVLPSKFEGLGRVIIEAMATGTPVIGSRVGGIPELVQDGVRGFLVLPGDEKALAEKLRWILSNPDKSSAMGKSGRAFVAQLFSTENYVKGYKQIFEMARPRIEHTEHAAPPLQSRN